MQRADIKQLAVDGPQQSLGMIQLIFGGHTGPARDIVLLNAGAAIYLAGLAESHQAGIDKAQEVIDSGAALEKLNALVKITNSFKT